MIIVEFSDLSGVSIQDIEDRAKTLAADFFGVPSTRLEIFEDWIAEPQIWQSTPYRVTHWAARSISVRMKEVL